jgi:hypothetical protein
MSGVFDEIPFSVLHPNLDDPNPCAVCYALITGRAWHRSEDCDMDHSEPEDSDSPEWHDAKEVESLGHIDQIFPDSGDLPDPDEMDKSVLEVFTDMGFYEPLSKYYMAVAQRSRNCWPSLARLCKRGGDPLLDGALDYARFLRLFLDVGSAGFLLKIANCGSAPIGTKEA